MSLRVSRRDVAVLAKCAISKGLTTGQLQRLYFPDVTPDAARKSLRRLSEERYLISFRENLMAEAFHSIGPKGKELLAARGLEVDLSRTPPRQIEHLRGINDIRIAIEAEPSRVLFFFAHWELGEWKHAVIPDAVCRLKLPEPHMFAIEYDRATETLEQLSLKFIPYSEGLSGLPFDAVILVTGTSERLETVRRFVRHKPVSLRLLGTPLGDIVDSGFYAPIFQDLCTAAADTARLAELVTGSDELLLS